jgi:ABC-type uncharacterized transport system involved in gliding motility auxiliary subunit
MTNYSNLKSSFFVFLIIFISIIAYQFPLTLDLTANKINSLSKANQTILLNLQKPLAIDLYSPNRTIIEQVQTILSLFQKTNPNITLNIHDKPLDNLDKTRLRLQTNNNLLLNYDDRKKAIDINPVNWNQQTFGDLIQQMIRAQEDWVVFLSGHGEREPLGLKNTDFSQLTTELKTTGMNIASLNLGETDSIPNNTKMLVIADPKTAFLPKETIRILEYLNQGGNLLWLVNPASLNTATTSLNKLAEHLGITWQPGTILDPKSHTLGTPDPAISLLTKYPDHIITQQLNTLTVFPWARPLQYDTASKLGWQVTPLLVTNASSTHLEANQSKTGPFTIGVALEKNNQRILAIGNASFLSNASIHNYGNLQLANNIFNWLMASDFLLNTTTKPAVDLSFTQSAFTETTTQFIFPFCLPLIYLLIGWRTKKARQQRCRFV